MCGPLPQASLIPCTDLCPSAPTYRPGVGGDGSGGNDGGGGGGGDGGDGGDHDSGAADGAGRSEATVSQQQLIRAVAGFIAAGVGAGLGLDQLIAKVRTTVRIQLVHTTAHC